MDSVEISQQLEMFSQCAFTLNGDYGNGMFIVKKNLDVLIYK